MQNHKNDGTNEKADFWSPSQRMSTEPSTTSDTFLKLNGGIRQSINCCDSEQIEILPSIPNQRDTEIITRFGDDEGFDNERKQHKVTLQESTTATQAHCINETIKLTNSDYNSEKHLSDDSDKATTAFNEITDEPPNQIVSLKNEAYSPPIKCAQYSTVKSDGNSESSLHLEETPL